MEPKFLDKVKVSHFSTSEKGSPKKWPNGRWRPGRHVEIHENRFPEDVYTVVGVTKFYEGETDPGSEDEAPYFNMQNTVVVYIVAKTIGRRYKVQLRDLQIVGGVEDVRVNQA